MEELSKPALEAVMNDTVQFHPPKFKNSYRHWMENVKDWCISRQLWWGHQIPAWFFAKEKRIKSWRARRKRPWLRPVRRQATPT